MAQGRTPLAENQKSFGANDLGSEVLFQQRLRYEFLVYPLFETTKSFDFWRQDRYYGRISTSGNSVQVLESNLKPLRYAGSEPIFAVNFVADAWRDFVEKVRELTARGVLYSDGAYADLQAKKGWQSPTEEYHEYMTETIYPVFAESFLGDYENRKRLKNLKGFLDVFMDFCQEIISTGGPVTMSGYLESVLCSVMNTGLVIEIDSADHGDDYAKVRDFLSDKNFNLITNLASHYGFSLDKNAPWRFVADISSAAMQEYMVGVYMFSPLIDFRNGVGVCRKPTLNEINAQPEPYGFSTIPGLLSTIRHATGYPGYSGVLASRSNMGVFDILFNTAFLETWRNDIDLLKLYLVDMYNRYVLDNPHLVQYRHNTDGCVERRNEVTTRTVTSTEVFDNVLGAYRDKWHLRTFYVLRLLERLSDKTRQQKEKDIRDAYNMYDALPGSSDQKYYAALSHMQSEALGPVNTGNLTFDTVGGILRKD
jgi:hypothetical protein|tara:strand:- start:91 stop:1530 length:1440 start_codon:yes stop_codon:yes gene_type:complete